MSSRKGAATSKISGEPSHTMIGTPRDSVSIMFGFMTAYSHSIAVQEQFVSSRYAEPLLRKEKAHRSA